MKIQMKLWHVKCRKKWRFGLKLWHVKCKTMKIHMKLWHVKCKVITIKFEILTG
jgi:hypothetical protein